MQTNPESAAVEVVAWDYSPEHRIAVTDGKGGVTMTLNGHGAPAGISLYHGDYVSELQSALDALRGEVEGRDAVIECKNIDIRERDRSLHEWAERAKVAERRVAEIHGALRIALASIDETCKEMTLGDRFTNAGQSLIDALPVCRAALTKESP